MRFIKKLISEPFAKSACQFMRFVCYFQIAVLVICLVLSFMGRNIFTLHTGTETYDRAIYAEKNHRPSSRWFTVTMNDRVDIWTNGEGQIDIKTQLGLSLMYAVNAIPVIFACWFLSRVFANVYKGGIFTEQNARYLLYYGLLQFFTALLGPYAKVTICRLVNLISDSRMSIYTGKDTMNALIPNIAFIVAAYIIHYGIHLQDEVDHTL